MIVVSDAIPVIALLKAERLDLLQKLYHTVVIPEAVYQELIVNDIYEKEKEIEQCLDIFLDNLDNEIRLSRNLCNRVLKYVGLEEKF